MLRNRGLHAQNLPQIGMSGTLEFAFPSFLRPAREHEGMEVQGRRDLLGLNAGMGGQQNVPQGWLLTPPNTQRSQRISTIDNRNLTRRIFRAAG